MLRSHFVEKAMPFYTHYYSQRPDGTVELCEFTARQAQDYKVELTELGLNDADAKRLIESFNRRGVAAGWFHSLYPIYYHHKAR